MGVNPLKRNSSTGSCGCNYCEPQSQNPDPKVWEWEKSEVIGHYFVLQLRYPNCTNYEGRKILVFRSHPQMLLVQGWIDPHFSESKDAISPIARFQPTEEGWSDAIEYAKRKAGK